LKLKIVSTKRMTDFCSLAVLTAVCRFVSEIEAWERQPQVSGGVQAGGDLPRVSYLSSTTPLLHPLDERAHSTQYSSQVLGIYKSASEAYIQQKGPPGNETH